MVLLGWSGAVLVGWTGGLWAQEEAPIRGMVGVGTWATRAEFKDIRVTRNGETLFVGDFSGGLGPWQTRRGRWEVVDGVLRQTSLEEDARAVVGDPRWSDVTLTLKARKLDGAEGFLVLFGVTDARSPVKSWWNIGGWGNTAHALQVPGVFERRIPGRVETGRWYDIRVELSGKTIRTFLDGRPVQTATLPLDRDAQREFPHALIPDLLADPSVAEFDGVFYLYGTTDGMGQGLSTAGLPVVWTSRDFVHWSFEGSIFPESYDAKYWAPSAPVQKDGRFYLFPTLDHRITVVVGPTPKGPFRTLDGRDINPTSGWKPMDIQVGHPIDADVFRDDDGSYLMVWSQRFMAKMKADFSGFDGEPISIPTRRGGYSEGPQLFKRNGVYYYLYTLGGSESYRYAYMMSRASVTGPWEAPEQDIIAVTDRRQGIYGPGHGYVFSPAGRDDWFFTYLEYGRGSTNRQVLCAPVHFNEDGTIRPIQLSFESVGPLRSDPRYEKPNLALHATVKASSMRPEQRIPPTVDATLNRIETFTAGNAVDGSNGSRWMAAADDTAPWLQVDLGAVRSAERVELAFVKPTAGHAYRLERSLDGRQWTPCGGHEDLRIRSPHVDRIGASVRYLRVTVLKGTAGLWEWQVY